MIIEGHCWGWTYNHIYSEGQKERLHLTTDRDETEMKEAKFSLTGTVNQL